MALKLDIKVIVTADQSSHQFEKVMLIQVYEAEVTSASQTEKIMLQNQQLFWVPPRLA